MKLRLTLPALLALSVLPLPAADLPPDKTTEIPASAKRETVVKLTPSQISNLKSQALPKTDLPEGFELQLVAAAPLVTHPIMACLDDRGRLFLGDATGVNWNKKQLEENPPNRVLMLEDTDGDGIYDKSTVFADKMTFPQGGCWLDGSLYVGSPPGIWKLTDTNGDGIADQREMIVSGFEYTGNAADIHGPWLHPNGRLYWCHGRKGHKATDRDGKVVHEGLACGIWSCKPDGRDLRWHALGCGDNPVRVDFTPEGEVIGVQNLYYTNPRGDTIVHWLERGIYERGDQLKAIEDLPRAVEHMPVMYNFGHVAVSGCCFWHGYGSADTPVRNPSQGGAAAKKNTADKTVGAPSTASAPLQFMVTHFNTQRVVRMELRPDGATYKATENEFLRLHSPDVHFTDVIEAPDGSLLVTDTGGWFRIGCPSSLLAKPDVLGAVYRVKKKGAPALAAKSRASAPLGEWEPSNDDQILARLKDRSNPRGRLEACRALRTWWHGGNNAFFEALHAMFAEPLDPVLEFAAIRAFVDQDIAHQGFKVSPSPALTDAERDLQEKRMILVTTFFAGTSNGAEPAKELGRATAFLKKSADRDPADAYPQALEACLFVISRIEQAPEVLEPQIREWLKQPAIDRARLQIIERSISGRLSSPAAQDIVTALLAQGGSAAREAALRQLAAQTGAVANEAWFPALDKMLGESPSPLLLDAIKKLKAGRFDDKLQAIANDAKQPLSLRLRALSAVKGLKLTPETFAMLQTVLTSADSSAAARIQAAAMLATAPLKPEDITALAPLFASVGPIEFKELLGILKKIKEPDLVRAVSLQIAKNPVIASQQESIYRTALTDKPADIFETIILPALQKANEAGDAKKRQLGPLAEKVIAQGSASAGRAIFESGKGTCIACHQVGDKGRSIGPNLSHIGAIRTERDLLESILFPSNTLARDYEAHIIETSDGQNTLGVIKSHTAEGLLLVDAAGQEKNIPHAQIVGDTQLSTSLMPLGLDQTLPEKELCDLVAYLRSLK